MLRVAPSADRDNQGLVGGMVWVPQELVGQALDLTLDPRHPLAARCRPNARRRSLHNEAEKLDWDRGFVDTDMAGFKTSAIV